MKDTLLHNVPVVVLAIGAVVGLTNEESNSIAQGLTGLIGLGFTVVAIWRHWHVKKKLTK